tara:strand:+ start:84 stop:467 length:384 start_codon:yes stop_codon:yes gene_type:complete
MKSNTSVLRIAKNLGSVGLLFSITKQNGVQAVSTESEASLDSQIKSMSSSVQQALSQSGSEALADSEIENMIQSHVQSLVEEQAKTEQKAVSNNIFQTFHSQSLDWQPLDSKGCLGWSKWTKMIQGT